MDDGCILIVESDVLVRAPLAEYLRECGYRVLEAAHGDEARAILTKEEASIDVVLANVNAPKESGFALATWIRQSFPTIDVILAGTVAGAIEKAADLCEEGPADRVPYDHKFLHDRIRQLLAGRARAQSKEKP